MPCNMDLYNRIVVLFILSFAISACNRDVPTVSGTDDIYRYLKSAKENLYVDTDSSAYFVNKGLELCNQADTFHISEFKFISALNNTLLGENDSALQQLKQVYHTSKRNGYNELEIQSLLNIGEIEYNWGNYNKAIKIFVDCSSLSKHQQNRKLEVDALNFIGKYYHSVGNYDESYDYYIDALELADEINYTEQQVSLHCKIGKHFETIGNNAKAMEHYLLAEKFLSQISNKIYIASTYNHLGNMYDILGDYPKALSFHLKALDARESLQYIEGRAKSFKNIGEVYENMEQYDSAEYYLLQSLQICEDINYQKGIIKSLQNLGDVYLKRQKTLLAREFYEDALSVSDKINYYKGYTIAALQLCYIAYEKKDYERTIGLIARGEPVADKAGMLNEMSDFRYLSYKIYNELGDYKKALEQYEKYSELLAKIQNEKQDKYISQLEIAYESEKKEQQNILLKNKNDLQALEIQKKNNAIIFGVVIMGLVLLLTLLTYFRYQHKNKYSKHLEHLNKQIIEKNTALEELNKELNRANSDKDKFFSIITHELRNPLWWFRNLAETLSKRFHVMDRGKQEKALRSLDESAKTAFHLIENLLLWSRSQLNRVQIQYTTVDIQELIKENLKLYSSIISHNKITISENFECSRKIYADKDLMNTIIRNILSNSVKFTPENGKIRIQLIQDEQETKLTISDSGVGISSENIRKILNTKNYYSTLGLMQEKGSGLGLVLCKEFTEMHKGKLFIESELDKGTTISVIIPNSDEKLNEAIACKKQKETVL